MNPERIIPIILCGGDGTRLWPRSRRANPKPFLPLVGGQTLFEEALERCLAAGFGSPVVVTGAAHAMIAENLAKDVVIGDLIVEPQPRQTAAAVALAAVRLPAETVMVVCSSDHHIGDSIAFRNVVNTAADLTAEGWIVCIGIPAISPATRFGYIQRGEALGPTAFQVANFVEKPDVERAEAYLSSGDYFWNGGIFVFRAGDYLEELERFRPVLASEVRRAVEQGSYKNGCFHPGASAFSRIDPEALDYAVMENTDRAACVVADMDWSDVGDWPTVRQLRCRDSVGNAVRGPAKLINCRNTLVDTDGPKVHLVGMDNVVVVVDGDDILIAEAGCAGLIGTFAETS